MVVRDRGARAPRRAAAPATWSSARSPTRSRPAPAGSPCVAHGVRADAGIVTEPTGVRRLGRRAAARSRRSSPSRAGPGTPSWRSRTGTAGGAVNAIEKMGVVLDAVAAAARGVARPARQAAPAPVAGDDRARDRRRAASGWSPTRRPARSRARSCTCRATPTPTGGVRAVEAEIEALDRRRRRRPTRGSPSTRRRSTGRSTSRRLEVDAGPPDRGDVLDRVGGRRPDSRRRARLVVRRGDLHALRRHPDASASARAPSSRPTPSTSTSRSTSW